jgi:hypothetical protein
MEVSGNVGVKQILQNAEKELETTIGAILGESMAKVTGVGHLHPGVDCVSDSYCEGYLRFGNGSMRKSPACPGKWPRHHE